MQAPKRRKLTNPPFRSPLKRNLPTTVHHAACVHEPEHDQDSAQSPSTTPTESPRPASNHRRSKPLSNILNPDRAQHVALDKEYAALVQKLRNLKHQLNVAEQALNSSTSDQVQHLDSLVQKWQTIAQDAADHVFMVTEARIRDHGGLNEWQKFHQLKHDHSIADAQPADHSSFTMEKLLSDLNIDIDVIGYDAEEQDWKT